MDECAQPEPELTTDDALFAGALTLRQPARGHRIGTDAVLLAAACPPGATVACDLGCGVGAVGLRIAQRGGGVQVRLIDNDPAILALAAHNVAVNRLTNVDIVAADAFARSFPPEGPLRRARADVALTNPPFLDGASSRASPNAKRAAAHVLAGDLDGWIKAASKLLAPRGDLVVIHRADALPCLMAAMERRFGGLVLRFVHPRAESPAHRVLVKGTLGSRAPLVVLPPLVLHGADGRFTPQVEAAHRGDALLAWG